MTDKCDECGEKETNSVSGQIARHCEKCFAKFAKSCCKHQENRTINKILDLPHWEYWDCDEHTYCNYWTCFARVMRNQIEAIK